MNVRTASKRFLPVFFLLTALFFAIPQSYCHASLLAYFNFDGNPNDVTGNGYNGTVTGATLVDGRAGAGQAYSFDGDDYITVDLDINPSNYAQLTMGAWVKADAVNLTTTDLRHQVISHDGGGYDRTLGIDYRGDSLYDRNAGWSAFSGSGGVLGEFDVSSDWDFIAAVYDQLAGTVTLYVNGQVMTESGTLGSGCSFVRIGNNPYGGWNNGGEFFFGMIDDVFFFDQALTTAQLDGIMANGVSAVPVPASLMLLCAGLLVPAWVRRTV